MQKIINFEKKYTVSHMFFILLINIMYSLFFQPAENYIYDVFFIAIAFCWLTLIIKTLLLEKESIMKIIVDKRLYNILKLSELVAVSFLIVAARYYNLELSILYVVIIIEAYIANEDLDESGYKLFYVVPFIFANIIYENVGILNLTKMIYFVFCILLFLGVQKILDLNIKEIKQKFYENKMLIKEKNDKNTELKKSQEELQDVNEKLREQKIELEKATEKFRGKAAEFYVLKEIGSFLGGSLEVENLLEIVVDVLSGVMGVDMCCVVLYPNEEDKKDMSFHIKTVYDKKVTDSIKNKIESGVLSFLMNNRDIYRDNEVTANKNLFFEGREVGSFAAVPLYKNDKTYGIVLLEQRFKNFFYQSIIDMLKSVSNQIVLAIENARLYESVQELAVKDPLTKAYNRTYMQRIYFQMLEDVEQKNGKISVSMFDIDHFKHVNDTYGHLFGDKVLKMIAKEAQAHVSKHGGVVIRYGGEEFLVLLPGKSSQEAKEILEGLRKIIESMEITEGVVTTHITVSFGVSTYPEIEPDKNRLIRSADNAVYVAKETGRNQVIVAEKE